MLQECENPACSVRFAVTTPTCPACGSPGCETTAPPLQPAGSPLRKQVVKSLLGTVVGGAAGGFWLVQGGGTQAVVIMLLGAFIGFALTLPGVSAARVAGGAAGMIVAHNAPASMRGKILDYFVADPETEPPQADPPADSEKELPDFLKPKEQA